VGSKAVNISSQVDIHPLQWRSTQNDPGVEKHQFVCPLDALDPSFALQLYNPDQEAWQQTEGVVITTEHLESQTRT